MVRLTAASTTTFKPRTKLAPLPMARSHLLLASGAVALLLSVTTAVLLFILGASIAGLHRPSPALPLVAGVMQALSCVSWIFLIWRHFQLDTRPQHRLDKRAFQLHLVVGIVPTVIAAIITGVALGWSQGHLTKDHVLVLGKAASTFLPVTFGVWGITLAVQVIHLSCTAWLHQPVSKPSQQRFSFGEGLSDGETPAQQTTEAIRPETTETAAATKQSNPFRETPSSSSPPSLIPSEGPSSMRSSFSTLPRPSSSKRGAIIRQPSYSVKNSRQSSFEGPSRRPSQDEGFDSWDTSQVSYQIREALQATGKAPPLRSTGLTPIPGSRSPSPAKALEGPFFDNRSPSTTPPLSPLPQPSVSRPNSPPSSPMEVPNFTSVFPPATSTPPSRPPLSTPTTAGLGLQLNTIFPAGGASIESSPVPSPRLPMMRSRPGSALTREQSEDHIHPLFRTSSPTPAPSPSLGTVVTAAPPDASQLINERVRRARLRTGSLPGSPSPLMRSESSPDMREKSKDFQPLSAIGAESPPPVPPRSGSRPSVEGRHQRKRSASFETVVKMVGDV